MTAASSVSVTPHGCGPTTAPTLTVRRLAVIAVIRGSARPGRLVVPAPGVASGMTMTMTEHVHENTEPQSDEDNQSECVHLSNLLSRSTI